MNKEIRTENANADPNKKLAVISVISVIIAVLIAVIFILLPKQAASGNEAKYNDAKSALSSGDYEKAYNLFRQIGYYSDSAEYLADFKPSYEKEDSPLGKFTRSFNSDGKLTEELCENGEKTVCTYDKNGNLTSITYSGGEKDTRKEYTYDENGNKLTELIYSDGKLIYEETNSYLENLLVLSESVTLYTIGDEEIRDIRSKEFTYNDNDELVKEKEYFDDTRITTEYENGLIMKILCEYNAVTSYDTSYRIEYCYNEAGNELSETKFIGDSMEEEAKTVSTYNENGKRQTYTVYKYSDIISTTEYSYDDKGNLTKSVETDTELDSTVKEKYFDENGNMIKQVVNGVTLEENTYYENNMIKSCTEYEKDGRLLAKRLYDERNNVIEEIRNDYIEGLNYENKMTYNEKNERITQDTAIKNIGAEKETKNLTITYTYNEYGNVLTVTEKDNLSETENTTAYTYEGFRISYEPYKEK